MTKKFEKRESYTHLYAKQLLAEWLRDGIKIKVGDLINKTTNWNHSVFQEYPITIVFPYLIEEQSEETQKIIDEVGWLGVADIVIKHEGMISEVFEIVNKNENIINKLILYDSHDTPTVYFINAKHILGQIKKPDVLNAYLALQDRKLIYNKKDFWRIKDIIKAFNGWSNYMLDAINYYHKQEKLIQSEEF